MENKKLIYIADDEINICNIIKSFLVKEGYDVETSPTGVQYWKLSIKSLQIYL